MLYNPKVKLKKVFLGGTTSKNDWRSAFVGFAKAHGFPETSIFNPVVEHWDAAAQKREADAKADRETLKFYYLGDTGNADGAFLSFYSLHEATMGLYDDPLRTAVLFDYEGLVPRAAKRLKKVHDELKARFSSESEAPIFERRVIAFSWVMTRVEP